MNPLRKALVAAVLCLLLVWQTGCTVVNPMSPDLLHPPRFTQEQGEIYDALEQWVQGFYGSGVVLVHPKRSSTAGEHRSAFIPFTFGRDGEEQTRGMLALYQPEQPVGAASYNVRIAVIKQTQGVWRVVDDLPGHGTDVDMVEEARISRSDSNDLVISWMPAGLRTEQKTLTILAQNDEGSLYAIEQGIRCDEFRIVESANQGILNDIVTMSLYRDWQPARAELIGLVGSEVAVKSQVALNSEIREYVNIMSSYFSPDGYNSILMDGLKGDGLTLTTDVIEIRESTLNSLIYNEDETRNLAHLVERQKGFYSSDVNEDGRLEIPTVEEVHDPQRSPDEPVIHLRTYHKIDVSPETGEPTGLSVAALCVFNTSFQYVFTYPDEWAAVYNNQVTVQPDPNDEGSAFEVWQGIAVEEDPITRDWRFIKYWNQDLSGALDAQLIMTIRIIADGEVTDRLLQDMDQFVEVGAKWGYTYYVYIAHEESQMPESGVGVLGISMDEFLANFRLFR